MFLIQITLVVAYFVAIYALISSSLDRLGRHACSATLSWAICAGREYGEMQGICYILCGVLHG